MFICVNIHFGLDLPGEHGVFIFLCFKVRFKGSVF